MYSPGDAVVSIITLNKQGVGIINADSLPTAVLRRNGTTDGAVTVTVTNQATGLYKLTFTIPSSYAVGDDLSVILNYTITTVPYSSLVWENVIETVAESTTTTIEVDSSSIIAQAMTTPKKVENDEGKVEERTINELILADQYTKQGEVTGPPYGMKLSRTRPPGTV